MRNHFVILLLLAALIGFVFVPLGSAAPVVEYNGTVILKQGYQFEKNSGYQESNTSALGALQAASEDGDFDYTLNYGWGSADVESINGTSTGYWEFLVNGVQPGGGAISAPQYQCQVEDIISYRNPYGENFSNASYIYNITIGGITQFPGLEKSVTLYPGGGFAPDGTHAVSNISGLAALDKMAEENLLNYTVSYGTYGYSLNQIGDFGDANHWITFINGSQSGYGLGNLICHNGDKITIYNGSWGGAPDYAPSALAASDCIVNITVTLGDFAGWNGSVSLISGTQIYHPTNNLTATYILNNNTDLSALLAASDAGFFDDINVSDSWYSSYGTFSIVGINGLIGNYPTSTWSLYLNGAATSMGLGGNTVSTGDLLQFCYGPGASNPDWSTLSPTPTNFTKIINISLTSVGVNPSPAPESGNGPSSANLRWSTKLASDNIDTTPLLYDGKVYISNTFGMTGGGTPKLYCLNQNDGSAVWNYTYPSGEGSYLATAAYGDGKIFVRSTVGKLYAISASGGTKLWEKSIDAVGGEYYFYATSSPVTYEDHLLIIAQKTGTLYDYDLNGDEIRHFTTGGELKYCSSPVVNSSQKRVYFAANNSRTLYALSFGDFSEKWESTVPADIRSSPVVGTNQIYLTTTDNLYGINISTGAQEWSVAIDGQIGTPFLSDGYLYVGEGDGLHKYSITDGTELWNYPSATVSVSPELSSGTVYFATNEAAGNIFALDASTGALQWQYGQTAPSDGNYAAFWGSSPKSYNGRLFIGTETYGKVFCFGPGDTVTNTGESGGSSGSETVTIPNLAYESVIFENTTFTKTAKNSGTDYTIPYNTALGILDASGYVYEIDDSYYEEYGSLFMDSVINIENEGAEGWMYQVNGITPGVGSNTYTITTGDKVVFYWSDSMAATPENSPHVIALLADLQEPEISSTETINQVTIEELSDQIISLGLPTGAELTIQGDRMYFSIDMAEAQRKGENVVQDKESFTINNNGVSITITLENFEERNDIISGPIASITLATLPTENTIENVGLVSGQIYANLYNVPVDAGVQLVIASPPSASQLNEEVALDNSGEVIQSVAYTFDVSKENLVDGIDIGSATLRMTVPQDWVEANGGEEAVRIVHEMDDGTTEILTPTLISTSDDGMMTFVAVSESGLSLFTLVTVGVEEVSATQIPAEQSNEPLAPEPESTDAQTQFSFASSLPISIPFIVMIGLLVSGCAGYVLVRRRR